MRIEQRAQRIDGEERTRAVDLVLRPADPLDVPEARRLVRELQQLPEDVRVQVDVSPLREIHPAGLAYVAYALARSGRGELRGLSRRQERLLAYLLAEEPVTAGTAASHSPW